MSEVGITRIGVEMVSDDDDEEEEEEEGSGLSVPSADLQDVDTATGPSHHDIAPSNTPAPT